MPEGPETRREARKISALRGCTVKLVPVNKLLIDAKYRLIRQQLAQIPKVVKVLRILPHGKELFLELEYARAHHVTGEDAPKDKDVQTVYLQCHMGMGGGFYTLDCSDPQQRHSKGIGHKHVLLEFVPLSVSSERTSDATPPPCGWGFADIRGFGRLCVLSPEEYALHLSAKGPDVLGRGFTEEYLMTILKGKRRIANILPDQRLLSGIGNYLRSEILWEAKIDPDTRARDLSPEAAHRLYEAIVRVPREAYTQGEAYQFRVYKLPLDREGKLTQNTTDAQKVWWTPGRAEQ